MTDDLLERILQEVRDRKEAARAAFQESRRLQAALEALGPSTGREEPSGPTEGMPEDLRPGEDAGGSGEETAP